MGREGFLVSTVISDATVPLADLLPKWQRERRERGAPPIEVPDVLAELRREADEDQPAWRRSA
jgi:hypothetical protein